MVKERSGIRMEFKETAIKGAYEIVLQPIEDHRGYFMRTYDKALFEKYGIANEWVQENHSKTNRKGVIRGMHFQFPPHVEAKLVRVVKGIVLDVFLDLRRDSKTFGQWDSIQLAEEKHNCAYVPRGCAHGFCTVTDECEVHYKVDNYYAPDHEGGIIWNDADVGIDWPVDSPVLSDKDSNNMTIRQFIEKYGSLDIRN